MNTPHAGLLPGTPDHPLRSLEEFLRVLHRPAAKHCSFAEYLRRHQLPAMQRTQLDGRALVSWLAQQWNDEELAELWLSSYSGIPVVDLESWNIEPQLLELISGDLARRYGLLPLQEVEGHLLVALAAPLDRDLIEHLPFFTGRTVEPVIASSQQLRKLVARHYGTQEAQEVVADLGLKKLPQKELLEQMATARPTVRLVRHIIEEAIQAGSSDIHLRPREHHVDLFFRIDGALVRMRSFDKSIQAPLISRAKIIGGMDIAETRLPQDGRSRIHLEDRAVDLRLSVMPTVFGESLVIRILDTASGLRAFSDLGFTGEDEQHLRELLSQTYGMVLVTGPTGSGKSTTLYAALQEVRDERVNVITVEDPVEYRMPGILQMQVNAPIGFTFARALRHILRHDPDILMIGEIRDEETAKMAVESALTGHLVLSTLHTNNAASAITRLLEIGVPAYLLNATLLGVLAQRLVRRICPHCRCEEPVDERMRLLLEVPNDEVFWHWAGCNECHQTGYKGRIAVYELLRVTAPLRELILPGCSAIRLAEQGCADGMVPLTQQALSVARQGLTSLAEVYRVRIG